MRVAIIPFLLILVWSTSCKNKSAPETPVTVSFTELKARKCVVDTQCAETSLYSRWFPVERRLQLAP